MDRAIADRTLPERYFSHPAVEANAQCDHPAPVYPVAIYLDKIEYSETESALGIMVYNVFNGTRHCCITIKSSALCRCGCRGWCTLFNVYWFLDWCNTVGRDGVLPARRHDFGPFDEDEGMRYIRAGQRMCCKFAVLFIKGD